MTDEPLKIDSDFKPYHYYNITNPDGSTIKYRILDRPIKEIWPHTLLDNTAFVCVYLPTEIEQIRKEGKNEFIKKDWVNHGYFVCNEYARPHGLRKRTIAIDDEALRKIYKINVAIEHSQTRWMHEDIIDWLKSEEKMDPKTLLELLHNTIPKYIELESESTYYVLYLWIIGTYFYRLFSAYPYLDFIGSKRAGKTKVLELINLTAFNSIMSPDLTSSVVFRLIEQTGATILIDEAENMKNQKSEQAQAVRTLLNQGFKRSMFAYRSDTKEKNFTPIPFNLYSPKAFGHINNFDDVLEDRCIQILMKRSTSIQIKNTHPWEYDKIWWEIRALCYRFFLDYADMIETMKQKTEELMPVSGRERELWLPILTLAQLFDSFGLNIIDKIRQYAVTSSEERQTTDEVESLDVKVVRYISDNFTIDEWYQNKAIHQDLILKGRDYDIPDKLGVRGMAAIFHRLGLKCSKKKNGLWWTLTSRDMDRLRETHLNEPVLTNLSSPPSPQTQIMSDDKGDGTSQVTEAIVTNLPSSPSSSPTTQAWGDDGDDKGDGNGQGMTIGDDSTSSPIVTDSRRPLAINSLIEDFDKINKDGLYLCTDCNAGPFYGYEETKTGNLCKFHLDMGHKMMRV